MSGGTPRGDKGPRLRKGDPIRATYLNDTRQLAEQAIGLGGGLVGTSVDGKTVVRAVQRGGLLVKTPAGGIAAASVATNAITPGTAECTVFLPSATGWDLGGASVTVYNVVTATIAGSTIIQCKVIDGRPVVDVEPC